MIMFIIINTFIKIIPIWILWNTSYKVSDFLAGCVLLTIFVIWLFIRLGSYNEILKYFRYIRQQEDENKPSSPLVYQIYKFFKI